VKKNALFDLMTGNMTDKIVPNAAFQWYPLHRLGADLDAVRDPGICLINVTTEPIAMDAIRDHFFPGAPIGAPIATPPRYDLRSVRFATHRRLGCAGCDGARCGQVVADALQLLGDGGNPFQVVRAGPADRGRPEGAPARGYLSIRSRGCPDAVRVWNAARLVREVTGWGMSGDRANWQYGGVSS
jgi:hypothetical protein